MELADDGQSAVERLRDHTNPIDVVLMDIQMPLMDGYEATHQIRNSLGLTELPVIALTAGAFKNQQAAALAAGMNGFVAKPFDVDELVALLQLYGEQQMQQDDTAKASAEPRPAETIVDTETQVCPAIDFERGLHNWGDVATYHKYLQQFSI